MFLIKLNLSG